MDVILVAMNHYIGYAIVYLTHTYFLLFSYFPIYSIKNTLMNIFMILLVHITLGKLSNINVIHQENGSKTGQAGF